MAVEKPIPKRLLQRANNTTTTTGKQRLLKFVSFALPRTSPVEYQRALLAFQFLKLSSIYVHNCNDFVGPAVHCFNQNKLGNAAKYDLSKGFH